MIERRAVPRSEVEVEVSFPSEGAGALKLFTHNVGPDGMLMIAKGPFEPGSALALVLALEDGPLRCEAEVVWSRPEAGGSRRSVGIAFRNLSDAQRARLKSFVDAHLSRLAEVLREFPIFGTLTDEDLQHLSGICFRQRLRKGDLFYREGVQGDSLFIIEHGTVRILRRLPGGEEKMISLASSGEVFGEVSLVTGQPHGASVAAVVDTRVLGMTRGSYEFLKWQYPRTALRFTEILMRFLCARLGRTTRKLHAPAPMEPSP